MEKKKIIMYIDWTDALAHLTGDDSYVEGETKTEQENYTRNQVNRFFSALEKLSLNYDVDIHCITGGTIDYLNGEGHAWINLIQELFISAGFPDTFKSVATEYGGDLLIGRGVIEKPFEDSKYLCTEKLHDSIKETLPDDIAPMVEISNCKYFTNIRFEKEDMTKEEFEYYLSLIQEFKNNELYNLYPYYCPGYGVEIDVLPKGFDKTRAVLNINDYFYKHLPKDDIALSVFNGDFHQIDLRMIDYSLTNDVLFVGSEDADIKPYVENTSLSYRAYGHKIECISMAMEEIAKKDLNAHPYDRGSYKYEK